MKVCRLGDLKIGQQREEHQQETARNTWLHRRSKRHPSNQEHVIKSTNLAPPIRTVTVGRFEGSDKSASVISTSARFVYLLFHAPQSSFFPLSLSSFKPRPVANASWNIWISAILQEHVGADKLRPSEHASIYQGWTKPKTTIKANIY